VRRERRGEEVKGERQTKCRIDNKYFKKILSTSRPSTTHSYCGLGMMDCVTMVLMERSTVLPLDLVVLINSFLYERLTDENFKQAIALWFGNEEECKFRFGHISYWNTSRVTNMEKAFYFLKKFNEDISRWNVSNVTNMSRMFSLSTWFNQDLSEWDVRNVTTMAWMFHRATQFNGDISRWNVSRVTDMSYMFFQATRFNRDLSQWDVRNVTDMRAMFSEATQFSGDLSCWDVRNVTRT
jgi:surface protein